MDFVGLAFSSAEMCARCLKVIIQMAQSYKEADVEVAERIVIVENAWNRTRIQIDFLRPLGDVIDAEHIRNLDDVLGILGVKLSAAADNLKKVLDKKGNGSDVRPGFFGFARGVRKAKYAFVKDPLDAVIRDLEDWQRRFDPSWFLIMRVPHRRIDEQLRDVLSQHQISQQSLVPSRSPSPNPSARPVSPGPSARNPSFSLNPHAITTQHFSPLTLANGIRDALNPEGNHPSIFLPHTSFLFTPIPYCRAKAARRSGSSTWLIVDSLLCRPSKQRVMENDVRNLAQKLARADPQTFGLLQCRGVIKIRDPHQPSYIQSYDLVFRIPTGMEIPKSLRQALILYPGRSNEAPSLNRRIRMAQELAKSVSYVHTFNFVHKSISPESVLLLEDVEASRSATFLVGFDGFRSAGGDTSLQGDSAWYSNIYRHPTRQGESPEYKYRMQHDVYSLGVCLLEIGLWESFVEYPSDTPSPGGPIRDFVAKAHKMGMSALICQAKEYMEELAENALPRLMGQRYADVVLSCLRCLDGNDEFPSDAAQQAEADREGVLLGVQFNELVLGRLSEIVV